MSYATGYMTRQQPTVGAWTRIDRPNSIKLHLLVVYKLRYEKFQLVDLDFVIRSYS